VEILSIVFGERGGKEKVSLKVELELGVLGNLEVDCDFLVAFSGFNTPTFGLEANNLL
jgi:hypothetical protein